MSQFHGPESRSGRDVPASDLDDAATAALRSRPMLALRDLFDAAATPEASAWLDDALQTAAADPGRIPVLFPQLPRRTGRDYLAGGLREDGTVRVETGAWRTCDAAGLAILTAAGTPSEELLVDLHDRGDLEERTMVLRALAALPVRPVTGRLLGEVQRTNQVVHVAAGALDSNLMARALDEGGAAIGFGQDEFNRLMLKLAFVDLPLARAIDATRHANPELSRMLQGLATEREAAGRKVWHDTNLAIAHAPTEGTIARLLGGLEHGDDHHRLAAAEGLAHLDREDLRPYLLERLGRENLPRIRAVLERAVRTTAS